MLATSRRVKSDIENPDGWLLDIMWGAMRDGRNTRPEPVQNCVFEDQGRGIDDRFSDSIEPAMVNHLISFINMIIMIIMTIVITFAQLTMVHRGLRMD